MGGEVQQKGHEKFFKILEAYVNMGMQRSETKVGNIKCTRTDYR